MQKPWFTRVVVGLSGLAKLGRRLQDDAWPSQDMTTIDALELAQCLFRQTSSRRATCTEMYHALRKLEVECARSTLEPASMIRLGDTVSALGGMKTSRFAKRKMQNSEVPIQYLNELHEFIGVSLDLISNEDLRKIEQVLQLKTDGRAE